MTKMELRRPQQAAPTEQGWHYARWPNIAAIVPVFVGVVMYGSPRGDTLMVIDGRIHRQLSDFQWFGPVPTCIEAAVPTETAPEGCPKCGSKLFGEPGARGTYSEVCTNPKCDYEGFST